MSWRRSIRVDTFDLQIACKDSGQEPTFWCARPAIRPSRRWPLGTEVRGYRSDCGWLRRVPGRVRCQSRVRLGSRGFAWGEVWQGTGSYSRRGRKSFPGPADPARVVRSGWPPLRCHFFQYHPNRRLAPAPWRSSSGVLLLSGPILSGPSPARRRSNATGESGSTKLSDDQDQLALPFWIFDRPREPTEARSKRVFAKPSLRGCCTSDEAATLATDMTPPVSLGTFPVTVKVIADDAVGVGTAQET